MKKQISIRDVAEKTGYSFQTVSRVLNGNAALHKASTVRKIEKAATELGYVQNLFARGMQSGKTWSIGLIIDPFLESFTEAIFRGAHDELMRRDYLPILLMHSPDTPDELLVKRLAERRVEGLIIRPYTERMEKVSKAVQSYDMPVVSVDYGLTGDQKFDFVGTADEHGGQMAAAHLKELGHERIAGIFADVESIRLRQRGFVSAFEEVSFKPEILEGWNFKNEDSDAALVKALLEGEDRPTAIFASGDFMLPVIYRVAHELGLQIPADLSVIGFGNTQFTEYLLPPATTLHQDAYEIGIQAAHLVIDRIENKDRKVPVRQLRLEPHLIVRESTAAPKG